MAPDELTPRMVRLRDQLRNHERNAGVVWFDGFHVRRGEQAVRVPGVHEWMRTHVFPEYNFRDAYRRGSAKKTKSRWDALKFSAAHCGRKAGLQAHADIEFFATASRTERMVRRKPLNPHSQKFIAAMSAMGLTMLLSEFVVYDEDMFATPVDVVCMRRAPKPGERELVLVELKTARTTDAFLAPGRHDMRPPFDFMKDGQASQAVVQVTLAQMVLRKRYGIDTDAMVLFSPLDKFVIRKIEIPRQLWPTAQRAVFARLSQVHRNKAAARPAKRK